MHMHWAELMLRGASFRTGPHDRAHPGSSVGPDRPHGLQLIAQVHRAGAAAGNVSHCVAVARIHARAYAWDHALPRFHDLPSLWSTWTKQ
eukprot:2262911-Amphidinium_carterae.2